MNIELLPAPLNQCTELVHLYDQIPGKLRAEFRQWCADAWMDLADNKQFHWDATPSVRNTALRIMIDFADKLGAKTLGMSGVTAKESSVLEQLHTIKHIVNLLIKIETDRLQQSGGN